LKKGGSRREGLQRRTCMCETLYEEGSDDAVCHRYTARTEKKHVAPLARKKRLSLEGKKKKKIHQPDVYGGEGKGKIFLGGGAEPHGGKETFFSTNGTLKKGELPRHRKKKGRPSTLATKKNKGKKNVNLNLVDGGFRSNTEGYIFKRGGTGQRGGGMVSWQVQGPVHIH